MQVVLIRYATERLMYRISISPFRDRFVLKGAWLFYLWGIARRATRDVDFLGYADASPEAIRGIFRQVAEIEVEAHEELLFEVESIRVDEIQKDGRYTGLRLRMTAGLGGTRIPIQVDLAFGERLVEEPVFVDMPVLLDLPPPRIRVYGPEASVAEKLEAIVRFGLVNTRFKDFFDIHLLSLETGFDGPRLQAQVDATFSHRGTPIPAGTPAGLSPEFGNDPRSEVEWSAFLRRSGGKGRAGAVLESGRKREGLRTARAGRDQ